MVSCFSKCENYCIYKVTYVRTEKIEEAPPPLEEIEEIVAVLRLCQLYLHLVTLKRGLETGRPPPNRLQAQTLRELCFENYNEEPGSHSLQVLPRKNVKYAR
jgi:hypothetical protein